MPEAAQLPIQKELQQKQIEAAIEIPPVDSSFVPSSDLATVQSVPESVESLIPAIVQL